MFLRFFRKLTIKKLPFIISTKIFKNTISIKLIGIFILYKKQLIVNKQSFCIKAIVKFCIKCLDPPPGPLNRIYYALFLNCAFEFVLHTNESIYK